MKGFVTGLAAGTAVGTAVSFMLALPQYSATDPLAMTSAAIVWIQHNLGYSIWLFATVLVFFCTHLSALRRALSEAPAPQRIARLDQLTDVWIQLFVGIGVIWTAIGMRSALQAALGDGNPELVASADSVLKKLVDGGILLALSTTIVGGIGSYLMRLVKTSGVGSLLHAHYGAHRDQRLGELVEICTRLEHEVQQASQSRHQLRPVAVHADGH